ncbi:MAG: DUF3810 domain-containing protein [Flavobacteriaceae bacterium]|nr:DUF3810 domain-containing protein [Flavobacteriaceae bacterium]
MKNTAKFLTFLLPVQIIGIYFLSQHSEWVEIYYSSKFYYYYSYFMRFLFGEIPFSVGDICYAVLAIYILMQLWNFIKNRRFCLYRFVAFFSVIMLLFYANWGLNYYREPIEKRLHFENPKYTLEELVSFTEKLIEKTNKTHLQLVGNDTIAVQKKLSNKELLKEAQKAYQQLFKVYPNLKVAELSYKNSLFSIPLAYSGFSGYLNPFTGEAQINECTPMNSKPATICHEMAHQTGIAFENEANFLAYLATTNSKNVFYQYSGYTLGLAYCLRNLHKNRYQQYPQLLKKINKGIVKDWEQRQKHWAKYDNNSQEYFSKTYDAFLKLNQQNEGIVSYGQMVRLILNYER